MGMPLPPKRALVKIRSARAFAATSSKVAFSPIIRPNKVKATVTDNSVSMVRVGLRITADQISGRYFILRGPQGFDDGPPRGVNGGKQTAQQRHRRRPGHTQLNL